jgi:hypothetical protein
VDEPLYFVDFLRDPVIDEDTGEVVDAHPSHYEAVPGGLAEIRSRVEALQRRFNEESKVIVHTLVVGMQVFGKATSGQPGSPRMVSTNQLILKYTRHLGAGTTHLNGCIACVTTTAQLYRLTQQMHAALAVMFLHDCFM